MVKVKCTYFKRSGKYYSDGEAEFDKSLFDRLSYPSEYGRRLRELGLLPGLNSGKWSEFFVIDVENLYSELVTPIWEDE
jgi:hypothetical protein